jgi:hypothetical protein
MVKRNGSSDGYEIEDNKVLAANISAPDEPTVRLLKR